MKAKNFRKEKVVVHEPMWNHESDDSQFPNLFNWYNYNKTPQDARKYFLEYLKEQNDFDDALDHADTLENVPFNNAVGWLCRIKSNCKNVVSGKYDHKIKTQKESVLQFLRTRSSTKSASSVKSSIRPTVQDHLQAQLSEYIGELALKADQYLQSFNSNLEKFDCYEWLKSKSIKSLQAKNISEHFSKFYLNELQQVLDKSCPDLVEAYSFLSKPKLKKYVEFISKIISDCEKWFSVTRQIKLDNKVPKIRKPKPPLKQVAKLKYLKEFENLKSVRPTEIVGAKILLVYNIKTRFLGSYVCNNAHGFSVKGSSILNFDVEESISKKLRKPETVIPEMMAGGKVSIRKSLDKLSTKQKKLNGRINKDTVLLRAF